MSKFIVSTFLVATLSAGAAFANDDVVPHYTYQQFNEDFKDLEPLKFERRMGGKTISIAGKFHRASDHADFLTGVKSYSMTLSKDDGQGNDHRRKLDMNVRCRLPDTPEVVNLIDKLEYGDPVIFTGTIEVIPSQYSHRKLLRRVTLENCSVKG